MKSQDFKQTVSALERVAQDNKRVTATLLESIKAIEEKVVEALKSQHLDSESDLELFDYNGLMLRYAGSKHGQYIHLMLERYEDSPVLIPFDTSYIGISRYYHNDFGSKYDFATRENILYVARNLHGFLENMIFIISSHTDSENVVLEPLKKMVETL